MADLTRPYSGSLLWSMWTIMVLVTLLGLVRFIYRADLPFSVKRTGHDLIIEVDRPWFRDAIPSTWPDTAEQLVLTRVNSLPIGNQWHVRLALAGCGVDDTIPIQIEGLEGPLADHLMVHQVRVVSGWDWRGQVIYSLIALLALGLAGLLVRERDRHQAAIPLAAGLAVVGASIALDEFGTPLPLGPAALLPGFLWSFIFPLLSPTILSFGSRFPAESAFWKKRSWIRTAAWYIAGLIGVGTAAGSLIYTGNGSTAGLSLVKTSQHALWLVLTASIALLLHGLISSYRKSTNWADRNRVRWVLLGITLGAVPPLFLVYLPRLIGWEELGPNWAAISFMLLVPACFAVAVVRHQLLDISVTIRQGIMYGPATLGVSLIFGLIFFPILVGLLNWLQSDINIPLTPGTLGAFAICAFLFSLVYEPLRKRYWRFVDRRFFRTKYSYGRTVREFNDRLGEALTGESVLHYLYEMTLKTVNPLWAMFTDSGGEWREIWEYVQIPEEDTAPELNIPFPDLNGLELLVGPKKSGMAYHDHDRALLSALTGLASTSLQRELLQRSLLEEQIETERLISLNQLKDDFLSLVSHDLRSPLSAIMLSADLMVKRSESVDDMQSRKDAERIKRNVQRLAQMVERLLHAARVEAGRVEPEISPCRLHDLAAAVLERHALLAGNTGILLKNTVPDEAMVITDAILLQEAVSNLVDNAMKVSEEGMSITIGAEGDEQGWSLTITDHGPGIPREKLDNLFDRGTISGTMQRTSGFGLGLYLVDQLVRLLSGSLELRETSPEGTTFVILLQPWTADE
ncbi:ATP-binding protein [Candidatus Zixiibacteriota bacterium]